MGERRRDGEASDDEVIELETAGGHDETEVIELDDDSDEEVKVAQKKKNRPKANY